MATGRTVRQVKHGERIRRSHSSLNPLSSPEGLLKTEQANSSNSASTNVEAKGYGPYKPVPPPKPLPQQFNSGRATPPPYRMPPYPLYNEPSIPGATSLDTPMATSSPANAQNLQTHSSKFPIEREVILSTSDKNSKIPILNDYTKKTKSTIAPDIPPKQLSAWTHVQGHQVLNTEQNQPTHSQANDGMFRSSYHNQQDYYNSQNPGVSTGAVPRSTWQSELNKSPPRQHAPSEDFGNGAQTVIVQIEAGKDNSKENKNKAMTKTYYTIKDMISSKFKSNKDNYEVGLNNVSEDLRKPASATENADDNEDRILVKKSTCEQNIYGKPRTEISVQHQYNQHVMQQQMMAQQAQLIQQYQINQAFKNQIVFPQHLIQARSQEILSRTDDYFQSPYAPRPPQKIGHARDPFHLTPTNLPTKDTRERVIDDRRPPAELRSPQQLERDSLRQKNFEARRAASHPQLSCEDDIKNNIPDNKPQPQAQPMRRGSQGNLMETIKQHHDQLGNDSGFHKLNSDDLQLCKQEELRNDENECGKEESNLNAVLLGAPRKKLEGEIGKIEGVYNIGHRSKLESEEIRNLRKTNAGSAASSDYDKAGQSSSNVDSGRGSAAYSSGRRPGGVDTSNESSDNRPTHNGNVREGSTSATGHSKEWVDMVETELRHILEPKLHELSFQDNPHIANSTLSESISSMTPPLPPLSPGEQSSPTMTPRNSSRYKHASYSLQYGGKLDHDNYKSKGYSSNRWHINNSQKHRSSKKSEHAALSRNKQVFGLENGDMTSTTTRSMDLESMLDGQSDSDGDISTTDARAIRRQLEGLEGMYSEVLKLLGVKKYAGRYQPSDPRFSKRRYGSISSLPSSSVSSRPIRDKRRAQDDRKKVRDIRGINKRFQRLESHVVTLARSVAHLSSEMRTQHLMIQEMENIRGEIAALRTQTNMLNVRSQTVSRNINTSKDLPNLANPIRVKKLTKFFGDEPPLLRLFLRKLGYEKYANVFETERIGMVELPYLTEERLQKMGVPLGPRLRIMEEAQISVCKDTTLCIV